MQKRERETGKQRALREAKRIRDMSIWEWAVEQGKSCASFVQNNCTALEVRDTSDGGRPDYKELDLELLRVCEQLKDVHNYGQHEYDKVWHQLSTGGPLSVSIPAQLVGTEVSLTNLKQLKRQEMGMADSYIQYCLRLALEETHPLAQLQAPMGYIWITHPNWTQPQNLPTCTREELTAQIGQFYRSLAQDFPFPQTVIREFILTRVGLDLLLYSGCPDLATHPKDSPQNIHFRRARLLAQAYHAHLKNPMHLEQLVADTFQALLRDPTSA